MFNLDSKVPGGRARKHADVRARRRVDPLLQRLLTRERGARSRAVRRGHDHRRGHYVPMLFHVVLLPVRGVRTLPESNA